MQFCPLLFFFTKKGKDSIVRLSKQIFVYYLHDFFYSLVAVAGYFEAFLWVAAMLYGIPMYRLAFFHITLCVAGAHCLC